jgi:hypothetical protein
MAVVARVTLEALLLGACALFAAGFCSYLISMFSAHFMSVSGPCEAAPDFCRAWKLESGLCIAALTTPLLRHVRVLRSRFG